MQVRSRSTAIRATAVWTALVAVAGGVLAGSAGTAAAAPAVSVGSRFVDAEGTAYGITNHLTAETFSAPYQRLRHEYLLVWAGAATENAPDFLAVVDATAGTPGYGRVVNTVTIDGQTGNEPHHMQYVWHKGQKIYAGGLVSDTTYVFDATRLPQLSLSGVVRPTDTPCGSAPDAFAILKDGTAYGTNMGGPDVTGDCRYSDGQVRTGNGFAGSPGEIVHIGPDGRVLSEMPAAIAQGEDPVRCPNVPALPQPSCANPHGIQAREDLDRLVTTDFAEIRNLIGLSPTTPPLDPNLARDTVRFFDIADRNRPRLVAVSHLPVGPRHDADPSTAEPRAVMEPAVTNLPGHRGAFASTSGGGAVFYTPDITAKDPKWQEVFDDEAAFRSLFPRDTPTSDGDGGGWLAVSPDDRYLFHVVLTGGVKSPGERETGMLFALDIQSLLRSGPAPKCRVDTLAEVAAGGAERDCPRLTNAVPIRDVTSGGPHWAAMDNFRLGADGRYRESAQIGRLATSNYFAALTGVDGDHRICMTSVGPDGRLSPDPSFRDEVNHRSCVAFDRQSWPHGETGPARPHGLLFAVADADLR
jgi:hypothetical protein